MWYVMSKTQDLYDLSDRLIRSINRWGSVLNGEDDIEKLIDDGADVNRLHGTLLPLQCACMVSDRECVQLLLDRGAKVNATDGYGRAALHYAAEKDAGCVAALIECGAYVDIRDANNDTPLHWASFKNNADCVRMLLRYGANVDALDFNDDAPISWAAHKGNLEAVGVLLESNATVNIRNYNGRMPLERCTFLLGAGITTGSTVVFDESGPVSASQSNQAPEEDCLELLIRANGQFSIRDGRGRLPSRGELPLNQRLGDMLLYYSCNARPLQELCRYVIRRCLGRGAYLNGLVPALTIPRQLQEFLLLRR